MSKVKFRWRVKCDEEFYMAADKQHAHELIDRLPPNQVPAAIVMLESLLDPVSRAIANAPVDDEPESGDQRQAVAKSKAWFKQRGGMESHTKRFSPILASLRTISRISKRRREDEENLLV
jgi:hypothetical protein